MVLNCAFLRITGRKSLRLQFKRFHGLQEGFLRQIGLIMHGTPIPGRGATPLIAAVPVPIVRKIPNLHSSCAMLRR